jgi:hypothetical protein
MDGFVTFEKQFRELLPAIIQYPECHSRWINTVSYLENCGAKMLAACEHPTMVEEEMLKHAAEEFRHAYYLKRQIGRITSKRLSDFRPDFLSGGYAARNYLHRLNVKACRHLQESGQSAYLYITYAIEMRAKEVYAIYQELLRSEKSAVSVSSILMEEAEHLEEITLALAALPDWIEHAKIICGIESRLCQGWLKQLENEHRIAVGVEAELVLHGL